MIHIVYSNFGMILILNLRKNREIRLYPIVRDQIYSILIFLSLRAIRKLLEFGGASRSEKIGRRDNEISSGSAVGQTSALHLCLTMP